MTLAVGYARVSTREQGDAGHGLDAQEAAIRAACDARGWDLLGVHPEVVSSRKAKRPALEAAMVEAREHGARLVVWRQSRISRNAGEMLALWDRAEREGWGIVPLNRPELETGSPVSKMIRTVLAAVDELERDQLAEATREGLASARINGTKSGRPIGRPTALEALLEDGSPDVETRERASATLDQLRAHRAAGLSLRKTADLLNAMGFAGLQGGRWTDMTVRAAERRYLSESQTDTQTDRSPSMGESDALSRVLAHADGLDARAAAREDYHEAFLADTARALRDSWSAEGRNYGSILHGGMGGSAKGDNAYAFNGGNANSWHYQDGSRRTLAGYRALYLEWAADQEGALALPAPEPPATLLADLETAHDLRARAEDYRQNVYALQGGDGWAFDETDRANAERVISDLLDTLDNARSKIPHPGDARPG